MVIFWLSISLNCNNCPIIRCIRLTLLSIRLMYDIASDPWSRCSFICFTGPRIRVKGVLRSWEMFVKNFVRAWFSSRALRSLICSISSSRARERRLSKNLFKSQTATAVTSTYRQ